MLNAPVKIDDLNKEWAADSVVTPDTIEISLLKGSNLHSKYVAILSYHRRQSRKIEKDYKVLKELRRSYFAGELNATEELDKLGWEPYQFTRPTNPEMERKLDGDKMLNRLLLDKMEHDEIVDVCMLIIRSLNSRSYELKAYVDYVRSFGEVK